MTALSAVQRRALALLRQGGFTRSVAGWHRPDDSLNAFHSQTMAALECRGLARVDALRGAALITPAGRRALVPLAGIA